MTSTSTVRVKEKIRYDVNVHRQLNKQLLLNTRRGVKIIDEKEDLLNVFTIDDMQNLALEIKYGKQITAKQLKVLRNAFLNGVEYVVTFNNVQGAVNTLIHFASSKNEEIQCAAIECFCNMALADEVTCLKISILVTPYLMMYINHLNFNISSMSIWTLGNLADANQDACNLLLNQNFVGALIDRLENSTCDQVIFNAFYALRLFLKKHVNYTKSDDLIKLVDVCFKRLNTWKESFWILYQISCCRNHALHPKYITSFFDYMHTDKDIIDIKCLVPILRTCGNIIASDHTCKSANEFIAGLQREGSFIRNILIQNRHINLNDECAWLLGNVFNALKITDFNTNGCLSTETFDEICNFLLV